MSSKKKSPISPGTNLQALKIGSRVRCTDDGVEGRIVWANAVAVKIRWDDGEQVTWRRDSMAGRPIEILAVASDEDEHAETAVPEQTDGTEPPQAEQEVAPMTLVTEPASPAPEPFPAPVPVEATESPEATALEPTATEGTQAEDAPPSEPAQEAPMPPDQPQTPSAVSKQPRTRKPMKTADDGKDKKVSALDAAAKVLGETGQPMSCTEMIEAMAAKGYWISPGGKTPQATLYSAIAREITAKGADSRFVKAERGKFARNGAA